MTCPGRPQGRPVSASREPSGPYPSSPASPSAGHARPDRGPSGGGLRASDTPAAEHRHDEHGLRMDCALNGCETPHDWDGEIVQVCRHQGAMWAAGDKVTLNGHRAVRVKRTVRTVYGEWRES